MDHIDTDRRGMFDTLIFVLSVLVIGGMSAEFIGMALGLISANELLIVCSVGAVANLIVFKLSKKALHSTTT
jgi:hypothetical protein